MDVITTVGGNMFDIYVTAVSITNWQKLGALCAVMCEAN